MNISGSFDIFAFHMLFHFNIPLECLSPNHFYFFLISPLLYIHPFLRLSFSFRFLLLLLLNIVIPSSFDSISNVRLCTMPLYGIFFARLYAWMCALNSWYSLWIAYQMLCIWNMSWKAMWIHILRTNYMHHLDLLVDMVEQRKNKYGWFVYVYVITMRRISIIHID